MLENSLLTGKPTIYSETLKEDIINLLSNTFHMPDNISFRIIKVEKIHVARPDIISQLVYSDSRYGDLICKFNGISNPFELNEGDILVIPDISNIDEFFQEDLFDDNVTVDKDKPKPKKKTEKRKPNEAVIGDTRFKIDKDKRVIIY